MRTTFFIRWSIYSFDCGATSEGLKNVMILALEKRFLLVATLFDLGFVFGVFDTKI